jgi:PHD/YefM family antitoxin component YafN of YafNO toxin-antitoxin module
MTRVNEGYVVDEGGNRIGVILPMEDYRRLMEEVEELESIRAYDAAKQCGEQPIPFDQAVREIQQDRR